MDFNDVNSKLKRLYSSLGELYDHDISSNIVDERKLNPDGSFEHTTNFGNNDPEKNQNLIMNVIHLINSLRDIIKNKARDIGGNPADYEKLIDRNLPLALITDLSNKDKHGDPLTRSNRSKKDPKITNIEQGLRGNGITNVLFTTDLNTGNTTLDSVEGDVKIAVVADIVDSSGNFIMPLHQMIEESLSKIENYLKIKGIVM